MEDSQEIWERSRSVHTQTRQSWSLCLPSVGKSRGFLGRASVSKPRSQVVWDRGQGLPPVPPRAQQRTGAPGPSSHLCKDAQPTSLCLFAACALAVSAKSALGSSGCRAATVSRWSNWSSELGPAQQQKQTGGLLLTTVHCQVSAEAATPFLRSPSFPKTGSPSFRRHLSW